MATLSSLPASFWQLVTICGLGFLGLWWFMLGAQQAARRRALRARIAASGPPESPSELATLHGMRQAIAQARKMMLRAPAPARSRNDGLYGIPWFLFIGDTAADVPGLLAAAHSVSPLPVAHDRDASGHAFWRWWFLETMTAIETSPAAVCDTGSRRARNLWYQALMELAEQRERLPLNGVVVCIGTPSLLGDAAAIEPATARLRHLVDEAAEHLQLRLPVYLVVTGLEQLPGYETVRNALPPEVLTQALGHRLPLLDRRSEPPPASDRLSELFEPIASRLHGLRLSLLDKATSAADRRAIHAFFDQVNALQPGLRRVVDRMFAESRGRRSPHWRGLYLTGVQADAGGAFVSDLFRRFLPVDQPVAGH
jgi:type VI protein secretion system component VasK